LFRWFLEGTFFRSSTRTRPVSDNRQMGGEELIVFDGVQYDKNPYCVFPLYYSYMTGISSTEFPLFNSMLEIYLKEGFEVSMRQSFRGGMSDNERANLALRDNSLRDIIAEWDNTITSSLVFQSGSFIFMALKNRVGSDNFDNFLYYYLEDKAFQEITFKQFSADFFQEFGVEIEPYFETINTKGKIPTFIMSPPDYIQTRDEIGEVYLIRFSLRNTGEAKGMVDVSIRIAGSFGGGGGGGGGSDEEKRLYELDPGVTKDIQITLFEQPRIMTINTLVSGNIPSTFNTFLRSAENVTSTNMEEYERISTRDLSLQLPGEIIVDNEDPGFHSVSVSHESKLKKYIESRKAKTIEVFYEEVVPNPWWTPSRWTPYAHSGYYGESVRSAISTRRGEGDNVATWKTILPSAGFYDVYVYIPKSAMYERGSGRRREGGQGSGGGHGGGPPFADERTVYNYIISSNEGTEEIEFPLRNTEDGWNKIGAFHFPGDTAKIQLTNETNGGRVIADAVKWVQR